MPGVAVRRLNVDARVNLSGERLACSCSTNNRIRHVLLAPRARNITPELLIQVCCLLTTCVPVLSSTCAAEGFLEPRRRWQRFGLTRVVDTRFSDPLLLGHTCNSADCVPVATTVARFVLTASRVRLRLSLPSPLRRLRAVVHPAQEVNERRDASRAVH